MPRKRVVVVFLFLALGACLLGTSARAAEMADLEGLLAKVPAYKYGESRQALAEAEALIPVLSRDAAQREQIEKRLLAILSSEGTAEGKKFVCKQLSIVGSSASVPALAKLLPDKDLSHMARLALERIPGEEAMAALREALGKVKGKLLVGVANSVGERGDPKAVAALTRLASSADAELAEAAIAALGKIGGAEAAKALAAARAKAPAKLHMAVTDSYLLCADKLIVQDRKKEAAAIYKEVYEGSKKEALRVAAFRGLLAAGDQEAWQLIIKTLTSEDATMWGSAAAFAKEIPGTEATKALAAQLPKLAPPAQVLLLGALAARGDPAAQPAVLDAAKSKEESVRIAALRALGRLGDAGSVSLLCGVAAAGKGDEQAAASRSLQGLAGKGVDAAIVAAMQGAEPAVRVELIRALAGRQAKAAVGAVLKAASDPDAAVRAEAMKALGLLADQKALPDVVKLLVGVKAATERGAAEKTVSAICRRIEDKDVAAAPVLAALPGPNTEVRCSLLRVLARIPSAKALTALRAALKDPDATVKDAAVRGLAEWSDAEPMGDLLAIARAAESPVHKVLALRGFVRMAALPSERPAPDAVKLFAEAMKLATRPEDKKLVLGALPSVQHVGALDLAMTYLTDPALEAEAATAATKIAKAVRKTHREEAKAAVKKILEVCKTPAARQAAEGALIVVDTAMNIAPQGTASSPDGWEKDGGAGGDQAAIDNNPGTYWDEADGKKLYRLVVTFKQPERISVISILGYEHHQYSPRDFDVLCDGKVVKTMKGAQYDNNFLAVGIGEVTCRTVELKITGYYGNSPAIRELGIYAPGGKLAPMKTPPKK